MENREKKYRQASAVIQKLIDETGKGFLGKPEALELSVLALVSGLHLLIEDVSGVGKTTLIRCLATASGLDAGRIQFTPDLLPGDITGMMIWESVKKEFLYKEGPIHHQFIMADELNRAPARTQSALLEAMQEISVTVDGVLRLLPEPFFVAAAQNPSWYAGTYNLPESQLDRFGLSMTPGYPLREVESLILGEFKDKRPLDSISVVSTPEEIRELRVLISTVHVKKEVLDFAVDLGRKTRESGIFQAGLSTRGIQHLLKAGQSLAVRQGRSFLIPEDLLSMAKPVMRHRLLLTPEARSKGFSVEQLLPDTLREVLIPSL